MYCAMGYLVNYFSYIIDEFLIYFNYVRELQFDEKPNYSYLKDLFTKLFLKNQYTLDYKYDWSIKKVI